MTTAKPWTLRLFFLHALLAFVIGAALYSQNEQFLKLLSAKVTSAHYQVISSHEFRSVIQDVGL